MKEKMENRRGSADMRRKEMRGKNQVEKEIEEKSGGKGEEQAKSDEEVMGRERIK